MSPKCTFWAFVFSPELFSAIKKRRLFLTPFFSPISRFPPFSAPILDPFFGPGTLFLPIFFQPQNRTESGQKKLPFSHLQNVVFYYKTSSFQPSRLFRKSIKFHRFWRPFWHHFRMLFASILHLFSPSIFGPPFFRLFTIFGRKSTKKGSRKIRQNPWHFYFLHFFGFLFFFIFFVLKFRSFWGHFGVILGSFWGNFWCVF